MRPISRSWSWRRLPCSLRRPFQQQAVLHVFSKNNLQRRRFVGIHAILKGGLGKPTIRSCKREELLVRDVAIIGLVASSLEMVDSGGSNGGKCTRQRPFLLPSFVFDWEIKWTSTVHLLHHWNCWFFCFQELYWRLILYLKYLFGLLGSFHL